MIPTASQFRYHPSFHHGSPELAQAYHHYHGPRAFRRSGGSRFIWFALGSFATVWWMRRQHHDSTSTSSNPENQSAQPLISRYDWQQKPTKVQGNAGGEGNVPSFVALPSTASSSQAPSPATMSKPEARSSSAPETYVLPISYDTTERQPALFSAVRDDTDRELIKRQRHQQQQAETLHREEVKEQERIQAEMQLAAAQRSQLANEKLNALLLAIGELHKDLGSTSSDAPATGAYASSDASTPKLATAATESRQRGSRFFF